MTEITAYTGLTEINRRCERTERAPRRRPRRKHFFSFYTIISIVLLSTALALFIPATAKAGDDTVYYKYFTAYMVQKGDTLWELAREYSNGESYIDYINEVKDINHLYSDRITAGQYIVIPFYSTEYME